MRKSSAVVDRPLSCAELARLVCAYLDGELDPATAAWAAHHLEQCPGCAPEADALGELRVALRELGVPPSDAVTRLREWLSSVR